MKTATLLAMPKAKGLLHRAICQAGVFAKGFRFGPLSDAAATKLSKELIDRIGIDRNFDRLAQLPMETLIAAQESGGGPMVWRPVIDGEVLPRDPAEVLAEGTDLNVPVIVGYAQHEADFIYRDLGRSRKDLETAIGSMGGALFDSYAVAHPNMAEEDVVEAVLTDWVFGMPSIQFAEARAAGGHPTYVYQFTWRRSADPPARATHGIETPFVFARLETTGLSRDDSTAVPLSTIMQDAWLAFARHGAPRAKGAPEWLEYKSPDRMVMRFDTQPSVAKDPRRQEREAWSKFLPDR